MSDIKQFVYTHIEFPSFVELYTKYKSNPIKYKDALAEELYKTAVNCTFNSKFFRLDYYTKQDLIQTAMEEIFHSLRTKREDIDPLGAHRYLETLINRIMYYTLGEWHRKNRMCTGIAFESDDEAVDLATANNFDSQAHNRNLENLGITHSVMLKKIFQYCINRIRYTDTSKVLIAYMLWYLVYEKSVNPRNKYLLKKAKEFNLQKRYPFFVVYAKSLYRKSLLEMRMNPTLQEYLLSEIK